jgi:hypothetical protein
VQRQQFTEIVEEVPGSLPRQFRERILNVAVLVEDLQSLRSKPRWGYSMEELGATTELPDSGGH